MKKCSLLTCLLCHRPTLHNTLHYPIWFVQLREVPRGGPVAHYIPILPIELSSPDQYSIARLRVLKVEYFYDRKMSPQF